MIKRIGFACKWIDHPGQVDGISPKDPAREYNTGTTTISWLDRQDRAVAEQRLLDLCEQNLTATKKLVARVGDLEHGLRMLRIGSDLLPAYTHERYRDFYRDRDMMDYLGKRFLEIGELARNQDVRLSMHPGQFTVLASENPGIVERSIEEFEYHADMARYMGFGKTFQDFKVNVHISGKQGPEGILKAYNRLSQEARNVITIENEENSWGLDDCLTLGKTVPIVLDVHHYWVREGQYIDPADPRVHGVIDSWRGIRPTMHYSISREDVLVGHCQHTRPDYRSLLESGYKKAKLRAHSDFYWNRGVNDWALSFNDRFDIMCEAKGKNLASQELYNYGRML